MRRSLRGLPPNERQEWPQRIVLKCSDVAVRARGPWPTTLIGGQRGAGGIGTIGVRASVDGRATEEQRLRLRGAAVELQRSQQWVLTGDVAERGPDERAVRRRFD